MKGHVLVVDQGTTSTRSIIFGPEAALAAMAQEEFPQISPLQPGWVEHDPELYVANHDFLGQRSVASVGGRRRDRVALAVARDPANQRETTLVWEPHDRATDPQCDRLAGSPYGAAVCAELKRSRCATKTRVHYRPAWSARSLFFGDEDRLDSSHNVPVLLASEAERG